MFKAALRLLGLATSSEKVASLAAAAKAVTKTSAWQKLAGVGGAVFTADAAAQLANALGLTESTDLVDFVSDTAVELQSLLSDVSTAVVDDDEAKRVSSETGETINSKDLADQVADLAQFFNHTLELLGFRASSAGPKALEPGKTTDERLEKAMEFYERFFGFKAPALGGGISVDPFGPKTPVIDVGVVDVPQITVGDTGCLNSSAIQVYLNLVRITDASFRRQLVRSLKLLADSGALNKDGIAALYKVWDFRENS